MGRAGPIGDIQARDARPSVGEYEPPLAPIDCSVCVSFSSLQLHFTPADPIFPIAGPTLFHRQGGESYCFRIGVFFFPDDGKLSEPYMVRKR